jgi:hypothetical protein
MNVFTSCYKGEALLCVVDTESPHIIDILWLLISPGLKVVGFHSVPKASQTPTMRDATGTPWNGQVYMPWHSLG